MVPTAPSSIAPTETPTSPPSLDPVATPSSAPTELPSLEPAESVSPTETPTTEALTYPLCLYGSYCQSLRCIAGSFCQKQNPTYSQCKLNTSYDSVSNQKEKGCVASYEYGCSIEAQNCCNPGFQCVLKDFASYLGNCFPATDACSAIGPFPRVRKY